MNKWFLSSTGSGDLSLTIKGILLSIVPMVLIIAHTLGHDVTNTQVESIITDITTGISALMVVVGLIRKLVFAFKK